MHILEIFSTIISIFKIGLFTRETISIMIEWPQQVMIFSIDNKLYAIPLSCIERVLHALSLKIYPVQINLPSLYGFCKINDDYISLINLRILFNLITIEATSETSILITKLHSSLVGLLCDSVKTAIISETELFELPTPLLIEARDYFAGVFLYNKEMVILLNPETLFRTGDLSLMEVTKKQVKYNIENLGNI